MVMLEATHGSRDTQRPAVHLEKPILVLRITVPIIKIDPSCPSPRPKIFSYPHLCLWARLGILSSPFSPNLIFVVFFIMLYISWPGRLHLVAPLATVRLWGMCFHLLRRDRRGVGGRRCCQLSPDLFSVVLVIVFQICWPGRLDNAAEFARVRH